VAQGKSKTLFKKTQKVVQVVQAGIVGLPASQPHQIIKDLDGFPVTRTLMLVFVQIGTVSPRPDNS
jgi:hypothetical protein